MRDMMDDFGFVHEQREEEMLEPSWANQLDYQGMQPHSREHLEYEVTNARSLRKYQMVEGAMFDYMPGIHFGPTP